MPVDNSLSTFVHEVYNYKMNRIILYFAYSYLAVTNRGNLIDIFKMWSVRKINIG
jgi:hypothetical protein